MQFRKVICYSYAHIQPTLISSSFRNLSTSSQLFKHQQQRYREAKVTVNEKSKSRRDAARELLMKTNRTKWEQEMAQLNILKGRIPTSDTYLISEFEPKKYSLSEAVELLRESAQPDMYDCMDNPVRVKVTLNMCTKKKTRFIPKFESNLVLPNILDFMPARRVLVICQNSDDREAYLTAGAYDAGGSALIQRISQGHYHWGEYDTVVAHQSWESQVTKLRHILKERLPTIKNGRFGEDMMKLMSIHSNSIQLESTSIDGVPEIGLLDIILGQLSWDFNRLEENLRSYLECIESQKSSRIINEFIQSGEIHCPPTGERFILDISQYCSLGNKSKANQLVDEGEEEEEDDDHDHDDIIDMMSIQIEKQQNTNELDI
ncbi:mitochondrial 54S ribosomal protein mrpl1 [Schistosoma haematobium]|uniref:50S ribosomal protein L1 n=1 Tax=Schistosoma haematobium TaxID=6185 RepID=A0A095BWE1_SCHHA|nr:mitochondrial 54S ribosomal protein mrpl1 [Schistosoma haematobium]KAH9581749.1 mitochondrial 54S ribosomal protein mrpl1 [Schistosoma haematobium]CAH8621887.1 unnamed protein product [Schistosoma haematobium]